MKTERVTINNIPSILWGEKSNKLFIAVHGNLSNKEDEVIKIFAKEVCGKGFQLLSFDLPEHGERKDNTEYLCNVTNCVYDLKQIMSFAKANFSEINLWACSMGAYFCLQAYRDDYIKKTLFLSPIVNMKFVIDNMMKWNNVSVKELEKAQTIKTNFGQVLYWDYYKYVVDNPIEKWNSETYILCGENDNLQPKQIIEDFKQRFNCDLILQKNGEHFFHTDEQLEFYKNWIHKKNL